MLWGNYQTILEKLDATFSVEKENVLTHLHVILLHALDEVIKKSKYFVLIESNHSTDGTKDSLTIHSPWIYHELYHRINTIQISTESIHISRNIEPFMDHFRSITYEELLNEIQK